MEDAKLQNCLEKLENVLRCMRAQNNGADVHAVGNIRNTATGILDMLTDDLPPDLQEEQILLMIKNCEDAVVQFFKNKFK